MRGRGLFDAYMDGVVSYVNHRARDCGVTEGCHPDHDAFRDQGYRDAELRRVLRRYEFTREKVRTRIEVHESGGAQMTKVIEGDEVLLERDRGRLRS